MFERFTESARDAVVAAQEEARRLDHNYIGTEHILLGVLAHPGCNGAQLLARWQLNAETVKADVERIVGRGDPTLDDEALAMLGIDLAEVRRRVEAAFGPGALAGRPRGCGRPGAIPFTPRAKKALELALRESLAAGHRYVGDEHVVLGLLREGDGVAARILADHGVQLDAARAIVVGRPAA